MAAVLTLMLAFAQVAAVTFATVTRGQNSGVTDMREVTVKTAAEWEALWTAHRGGERPSVDFTKNQVAGVFLGTRPTGGYSVEIVTVRREATGIVIEYVERTPAPDALVTQALTSPFHLVTLERVEPVRFSRISPPPPSRN